jgi:hypothetical protein
MSWAEELRTRVKAMQKEWEKSKERVREVKEHEEKTRKKLLALQVLLESEEPNRAKGKENVAGPVAVPAPFSDAGNKAEIVRLLINENGAGGLAPKQLRTMLEARNVEMPTNYLYAVLLRAKRAETIVEKNGKYYPAEGEAKAAN